MADANPSILSHISIGTNQFDKSTAFYDQVLTTLGCKRIPAQSLTAANTQNSGCRRQSTGNPRALVTAAILASSRPTKPLCMTSTRQL